MKMHSEVSWQVEVAKVEIISGWKIWDREPQLKEDLTREWWKKCLKLGAGRSNDLHRKGTFELL
jgi:hypothetical protein